MEGVLSLVFVRALLAAAVISAWMFVSSYLIILNRHIMVDLSFPYPMTLSGMGMVCSWALAVLCCYGLRWVEPTAHVTIKFWTTRILPIGFFMAITLWTGNEVYLYLTVSFIQMLKAFTPVITMACLTIAGLEVLRCSTVASVVLTSVGIALAAYGEVRLSLLGLAINTVSAFGESIRLVMTQWLLTGLKFHPIEGLVYLSPACVLWLYGGALVLEAPTIWRKSAWSVLLAHPLKFLAAASLGFLVNILAMWSIKLSSALTVKVLGTVKNTLLVVASVVLLGEVVTGLQGVGYAIALTGFAWYTSLKTSEASKHAKSEALQSAHKANRPDPHAYVELGTEDTDSAKGVSPWDKTAARVVSDGGLHTEAAVVVLTTHTDSGTGGAKTLTTVRTDGVAHRGGAGGGGGEDRDIAGGVVQVQSSMPTSAVVAKRHTAGQVTGSNRSSSDGPNHQPVSQHAQHGDGGGVAAAQQRFVLPVSRRHLPPKSM